MLQQFVKRVLMIKTAKNKLELLSLDNTLKKSDV